MERPNSKSIPTTPGVYLYKDIQGHIIYVGKARNLRKRVLSYFQEGRSWTPKTKAMMNRAFALDTISTSTEKEALLLESSLIKKHRPKYNIVLRDDKQYVLFRIQKDVSYPRLEIVRQVKKDKARYFGPFTSGSAARETWKTIHYVFPLRRCSDQAFKNRVRPCLYFYLKQCIAPCTEKVDPKEYAVLIDQVELFLSGRSQELIALLQSNMKDVAEKLFFEKAASIRDQIQAIMKTIEKQHVVLPEGGDMDVIAIAVSGKNLGIGLLFVREGKFIDNKVFFWPGLDFEDAPEVLVSFLGQIYSSTAFIPSRIVIPMLLKEEPESEDSYFYQVKMVEDVLTEIKEEKVCIDVPKNMHESKLMDMALINIHESAQNLSEEQISVKLAKVFHSSKPISRIECVDVSHTSGKNTRIGMVVFEEGKAKKEDYRLYTPKSNDISIVGGDDYAALAIWMEYRLKDGEPWADLVLIDGGRGQVNAVQRVLDRYGIEKKFFLAGIVKSRNSLGRPDRRAGNMDDIVFLSGRINPMPLKPGSSELLFLQHIRNIAHAFAHGRHQKAREKEMLFSELLKIPGVGKTTEKLLWSHFKNIDAIANATAEDLQMIPGIGAARAQVLSKRLQVLRKE